MELSHGLRHLLIGVEPDDLESQFSVYMFLKTVVDPEKVPCSFWPDEGFTVWTLMGDRQQILDRCPLHECEMTWLIPRGRGVFKQAAQTRVRQGQPSHNAYVLLEGLELDDVRPVIRIPE
jgi:hypothetical protein